MAKRDTGTVPRPGTGTVPNPVAGLGLALDIDDPYGGSWADYEAAFAEIQRCVLVLRRAWLGE